MEANERMARAGSFLDQAKELKKMAIDEIFKIKTETPTYRMADTSIPSFFMMIGSSGSISFKDGRIVFYMDNSLTAYASGKVRNILLDEVGGGFTAYTKNGYIRFKDGQDD